MSDRSIPQNKLLFGFLKALIRIAILILYVFSLFVFKAGAFYYIEQKGFRKTLVEYTDQNMPDYSEVLLEGSKAGGSSRVVLGIINISKELDPPWSLYQTPGYGEVAVARAYDSCHYTITEISDTRKRVKLTCSVGGHDVPQVFVYEIEDNRVHPISYNPSAAHFEKPHARGVLIAFVATLIFIALFEILIVRRFLFKKSHKK
jgi:hypothetical protein